MTRADNADLTKLAKLHEPGPRDLACMFLIFVGSVVLLPPLLRVSRDGEKRRRHRDDSQPRTAAATLASANSGMVARSVAERLGVGRGELVSVEVLEGRRRGVSLFDGLTIPESHWPGNEPPAAFDTNSCRAPRACSTPTTPASRT